MAWPHDHRVEDALVDALHSLTRLMDRTNVPAITDTEADLLLARIQVMRRDVQSTPAR